MPLRNRSKNLSLFVFVVLAFLALGFRVESQDRDIREITHRTDVHARRTADMFYEACLVRNANVARLNKQNKAIYNIELHNRFIDEKVRAERLAIYGVVLVPATCERPNFDK